MANATAELDSFYDDDRFLPRYLTVQLLQILAKTFPTKVNNSRTTDATALAFIDAHRNTELFNPLTYGIFWREYTPELISENQDILDELDQFGRSALTVALANEDFELANKLIAAGAIVFLEDKIILEIALISMLQRDDKIIEKIMANAPADATWAQEYLDYLHSCATGKPATSPGKYRDVLNPLIRHFGQVLDTMVYFNGTPSHYGFISPSLEVLSNHLEKYVTEIKLENDKKIFQQIADAFTNAQRISKFHGNLPTGNAAESLAQQIESNIKKNNTDVTLVFGGWAGNSVVLAFINKFMVLSNLGMGGNPQSGTAVYEINKPENITAAVLNKFMRGMGDASDPREILGTISSLINPKPLITINQFLTPIDNCIFVNPRAVIQGIMLVLAAYQKDKNISSESLNEVNASVANLYQAYVNSLYQHSTADLAAFMRNQDLLKDRRIECCSLAIEYINQHYTEQEAIRRCIDLKNALEFVGLRDYYYQNILPEAQDALHKAIIREQEAIALQVIEQEFAMQAQQSQG